jgi:DNA-binding HxlR family transcriptional regulator
MSEDCQEPIHCPIGLAISIIGGKWKLPILYYLRDETLRFSELKKKLPKVTQKMLTQQLRELESDKMVSRKVYAEVPPKVEYSSTSLAKDLQPILDSLCDWGVKYQEAVGKPDKSIVRKNVSSK